MVTAQQRAVFFTPHAREVALTLSGNEITDATRTQGVQGDGLSADSSFGIWEATTNLVTNGGFETNTTGWTAGASGANPLTRSTTQKKFGAASGKFEYGSGPGGDSTAGFFVVTLTAAAHSIGCWIYIPADYDSSGVSVYFDSFTSATGTLSADANMALRDQWQFVSVPSVTPDAGDLLGGVLFRHRDVANTGGLRPTNGQFFYVDGVQCELQPIATPYVETNGGTASRSAARVQMPVAGLFTATQGWLAFRMRWGWAQAVEPYGGSAFVRFFSWDIGSDNRLRVYYRESGDNVVLQRSINGGLDSVFAAQNAAPALGDLITVVAAWTAAGGKISLDGAAFSEDAGTDVPDLSSGTLADIGSSAGAAEHMDGDLLWLATGEGTLTDADAATLHAYGNAGPNIGSPPRLTGLWKADNGIALRRIG